jgi:hypothetical protein
VAASPSKHSCRCFIVLIEKLLWTVNEIAGHCP